MSETQTSEMTDRERAYSIADDCMDVAVISWQKGGEMGAQQDQEGAR